MWTTEKILSSISAIIVLTVPTISFVTTSRFHNISETSFMWPWMVVIRLQPSSYFESDLYNFILPPWTLIVYLPFLFLLKACFTQFRGEEFKAKTSGTIVLLALLQIFVIWMLFQSQDPSDLTITEERTIYYLPQLAILILQGVYTVRTYFEETQRALSRSSAKKVIEEEH